MLCKICSCATDRFAMARLLEKYPVQYFQCPQCGFTQTETPYWLNEVYAEAINDSDIGLVQRNIRLSKISKVVICSFFHPNARFIDYGGGYGLFVRLMRDAGLDFYRFDKFCPNLFAKEFEAEGFGQYELATAFEVFEHFVNPLEDAEGILRFSNNILFSTQLMPPHNPKPDAWWYYGLDHGQHVALYTRKSLALIAQRFGLNLYSDGRQLHLFTEKRLPPIAFQIVARSKAALLLEVFFRRASLIPTDYRQVTGRDLE